jgi:hypothetical protein
MKIGLFGSCQLRLSSAFFLNEDINNIYNFKILFSLAFFEYDPNYVGYQGVILDYSIFDELDCLIIEINNLQTQASSTKIIEYCLNKNIKIVKTFLIKFPIYPINWSGYSEYKKDYLNWNGLDSINYKERFKSCIISLRKSNAESDLDTKITDFIEDNFNKQLLFTHSLHPTNILLYELWRGIFSNLSINIDNYNYQFKRELILCWYNPFTTKMIKDLDIKFSTIVNDKFYIDRYNKHKSFVDWCVSLSLDIDWIDNSLYIDFERAHGNGTK